jgi:glycosyltransferase involved in cell wall biosynthesis
VHVALNAVHLVPGETGGFEIYARRLIPALAETDPDLRLTVVVSREAAETLRRERWRADLAGLHVDARSRVRAVLAEQLGLPRLLRRLRPDLVHNLMSTAPVWSPMPQVTTIHDLIHRTNPETHAGLRAWGLRRLVPLAARRSKRILAVSQSTADDVVRVLGVPRDRVDVAPNGPGSPPGRAAGEREVRQSLHLGDAPIVLAVSAKRPHKNLERLVDAMGSIDAVLVIPGYPTAFEGELATLAEGSEANVRITGWLDGPRLEGLYRSAACFVFPSLAEGFGMPVLEAMARGVPVACSNIPPLREVAGEAAVFFEPTDTQAIRAAIAEVLDDVSLRERLRSAGLAQAGKFSWAKSAEATLACYRRALGV